MRYLIIAVALVALFPLTTSAQSIVGAWERVSITIEGGRNSRTVNQKGFAIFTENHIAVIEDDTMGRRPLWDESTTDAQRLENYRFFSAGAGSYEMGDGKITLHLAIAGRPNMVGGPLVFDISFEGNDSFTSVITNANGVTFTRKYTRVK